MYDKLKYGRSVTDFRGKHRLLFGIFKVGPREDQLRRGFLVTGKGKRLRLALQALWRVALFFLPLALISARFFVPFASKISEADQNRNVAG